MGKELIDITDRTEDYKQINTELWRSELGIRSICIMYDDHSSDKNSKENIFILKDNIEYRLFSAIHQYYLLLKELGFAEKHLANLNRQDALSGFVSSNPHFDKIEQELSSIFDNIIFQLSSVFDYLSHMICYICQNDKTKTDYWTKLAKASRGNGNEISKLKIREVIHAIDNRFVGRLYDYRSRLLHNKRDKHPYKIDHNVKKSEFNVKIIASETAIKKFKIVSKGDDNKEFSLSYLSSWLIKRSFFELEEILDALTIEIKKESNFGQNIHMPKSKMGMIVMLNPKTKFAEPASETFWNDYKSKKNITQTV